MPDQDIISTLSSLGVIPVIAIDTPEAALPLADALLEGGLPIAEITFRTRAAAEVIRLLAKERPQLVLGAGTVLNRENLVAAKQAGAQFAVAPGFHPAIVSEAAAIGLPFFPGVATPSEIEQAMAMGRNVLKFFPSEALGGVSFIQSVAAPYAHTGLRLIPTGGVGPANLEQYLSLNVVVAVGGTWIAKKEDIATGSWDKITERCRAAKEIVAHVKDKQGMPC